ncbi:hypothetical protein [Archangium lipolyticum]|uniref:hypothetical protein n=1 Tax=Archangium lipolyticum TaxID=2970465 RepID=UPI002149F829|nr:hypothetical protein [Archangium lipolyticum]
MAGEDQKVRRSTRSAAARERTLRLLWTLLGLVAVGVVLVVPQVRDKLVRGLRYSWEHFFFFTWLGICALLPSVLAFAHRVRSNRRYVGARMEVLRCYLVAARHYASTRGRAETARIFTAGLGKEAMEQNRPGVLMLLGGAAALSIPFLLVATLSAAYMFPDLIDDLTQYAAVTGDFEEGLRGLMFAGFGVYVYTLLLIIHRMQSAALSSEFLLGATLRALITLVLGFVAGQTQLIQAAGTDNQSRFLYFTLGAFPTWALQALRRRVVSIFQPTVPSQEALSLEYVDGVNDRITERLEELGISDIQHLASSDPGELTLRTLYPLARAVDWVDQAILITYLRDKIGVARQLGVRGAVDMRELFLEARQRTDPEDRTRTDLLDATERARTLLQDLATRSGLPPQAIYNIGARLAEDYQVDFLAYLRNRRSQSWPLRTLVEAIGRALEDAGMTPQGEPDMDGIPGGSFDARQLDDPEVQKRFKDRLAQELHAMSLEWTGTLEELRQADSYQELYDILLARIRLRPNEPSQALAQPPGGRFRLPRWLQRTH